MKRDRLSEWLHLGTLLFVLVGLILGIISYRQADDATDQVVAALAPIEEHAAGTYYNTRDLRTIRDEAPAAATAAVESPELNEHDAGHLGECRAGLNVGVGEYCTWMGSHRKFAVTADGACSPWDALGVRTLNHETIKVDLGSPLDGTTFQAKNVQSGTWAVLAAGFWLSRGECAAGMQIDPGQFCIERASGEPFSVYATDELIPEDNRPLYPDGYAVLFWWRGGEVPHPDNGRLHDRVVVSGDHFEAVRRSGASWEIVKAD